MGAYLVRLCDQIASGLGSDAEVHSLDIAPRRPDMPRLSSRTTLHQCSLVDREEVDRVFRMSRPDTVWHCASMIDCRPCPDPLVDSVNVEGTRLIIELCIK